MSVGNVEVTGHHCQGAINYRMLPGDTREDVIDGATIDVVYSLAANWHWGSSGMLDWICIYDHDGGRLSLHAQ